MLVGTGAEIALVSRFRDGQTRLTARAPRSSTQQGVHLGNLMAAVAERIGGEGGGHDGAAGWSGKADRIAAESAFIAQVAIATRKEDPSLAKSTCQLHQGTSFPSGEKRVLLTSKP